MDEWKKPRWREASCLRRRFCKASITISDFFLCRSETSEVAFLFFFPILSEAKSPASNCAAIADQFFNVEPTRVLMGVFEALPQISIPDPLLSHYSEALDCLVDYDVVLRQSHVL